MAYLTYVAKREIEPTGYSKAGADISAASADDSFNSVTTVLTGLTDNEWVLVAGFADAANNGWFQASANSTSTKVAQDTSAALVTEAAGPSITLVGYVRGLDQSYTLEFVPETASRNSTIERTEHRALGGGAAEVIFQRRDVTVDVVSLTGASGGLITEAQLLQWREWHASVSAGELFTFDRYGTAAVPVEPKTAQLASPDLLEERIAGFGSLGEYRLSFTVRLLN